MGGKPQEPQGNQQTAMNRVTRRHFFQGAATAASAIRAVGTNDRIHIGTICLDGGRTSHLRYYSEIAECQITSLCDVNQPAGERAQLELRATAGLLTSRLALRLLRCAMWLTPASASAGSSPGINAGRKFVSDAADSQLLTRDYHRTCTVFWLQPVF